MRASVAQRVPSRRRTLTIRGRTHIRNFILGSASSAHPFLLALPRTTASALSLVCVPLTAPSALLRCISPASHAVLRTRRPPSRVSTAETALRMYVLHLISPQTPDSSSTQRHTVGLGDSTADAAPQLLLTCLGAPFPRPAGVWRDKSGSRTSSFGLYPGPHQNRSHCTKTSSLNSDCGLWTRAPSFDTST
ncbi:hypothetical protein L226DRAFT_169789 [Lentinus tigrinus ALCF2SS1-7]|uniref:uncharacterized protein n=1 Tax=Lentinus tigrinus ALCF2SS1-7 TaxID=1328758 RepID=UPI001165ED61|nr:hypothetical protein L226DRAFT_169789 [Lentinus tigrinus ALCF2SS1-7]